MMFQHSGFFPIIFFRQKKKDTTFASLFQVKIIAGKDKGKTGEILEINRRSNLVKVKSINLVKKHQKPTKENKGGIISKESFIHQSNIKNLETIKKEKKTVSKK